LGAAAEIVSESQCVGTQCDSASWDDQLALFELAVASYERVDYVVVNAGTTLGNQDSLTADAPAQTQPSDAGGDDVPSKPNLEALETNLVGALYTVRLALSYFTHNPSQETTVVLIGSVENEKGVLDVTSDHGLLGLGRAMRPRLGIKGSRIVVIAPGLKGASLLGIPLEKTTTPGPSLMTIERVAGAVVLGATDPNINVNGSVYGIVDDHQVFRIGSAELSLCDGGLFKLLFGRLQFLFELEESIWQYAKWFLGAVNGVSGRFFGSK